MTVFENGAVGWKNGKGFSYTWNQRLENSQNKPKFQKLEILEPSTHYVGCIKIQYNQSAAVSPPFGWVSDWVCCHSHFTVPLLALLPWGCRLLAHVSLFRRRSCTATRDHVHSFCVALDSLLLLAELPQHLLHLRLLLLSWVGGGICEDRRVGGRVKKTVKFLFCLLLFVEHEPLMTFARWHTGKNCRGLGKRHYCRW